jgi:hypothetical protein
VFLYIRGCRLSTLSAPVAMAKSLSGPILAHAIGGSTGLGSRGCQARGLRAMSMVQVEMLYGGRDAWRDVHHSNPSDRIVGVTESEAVLLCHSGTSYGCKEEVALARYNGVEEFVRAHPQSPSPQTNCLDRNAHLIR